MVRRPQHHSGNRDNRAGVRILCALLLSVGSDCATICPRMDGSPATPNEVARSANSPPALRDLLLQHGLPACAGHFACGKHAHQAVTAGGPHPRLW